jgi:hypothetical protein
MTIQDLVHIRNNCWRMITRVMKEVWRDYQVWILWALGIYLILFLILLWLSDTAPFSNGSHL